MFLYNYIFKIYLIFTYIFIIYTLYNHIFNDKPNIYIGTIFYITSINYYYLDYDIYNFPIIDDLPDKSLYKVKKKYNIQFNENLKYQYWIIEKVNSDYQTEFILGEYNNKFFYCKQKNKNYLIPINIHIVST